MKRRFSHGEEEVRDDLPTEVRDERFRRQRRRRPKIRARSPLWVCPVASAALGHKIERRPLSVTRQQSGVCGFLSEIRTRTKALKGKKGVGPEQNLRAPGGRGGREGRG